MSTMYVFIRGLEQALFVRFAGLETSMFVTFVLILYPLFYSITLFWLQMCFDAFDPAADLDVLDHPVLNFIYYLVSFYISKLCLSKINE